MNSKNAALPDKDITPCVLIVDDDEDFVESLVEILEPRGYRVETAHDEERALAKAGGFETGVALIDIRLGRSNGIELITAIRKVRQKVLCVMITAYADVDNAIRAIQKGAYDYLRKPFSVQDLLATLDRAFERLRLQREKERAEVSLRLRNQELEEINSRLRNIVESTKGFTIQSRLGEIGPLLLEEFARNMAAGGGSLFLRDGEGLVLVHSLDPGHAPATIAFPLRKGSIFDQAISSGEPVLIRDIKEAEETISSGWHGYQGGSLLVFPLPDEKGDIVGVISLHNKVSAPFTPQDRELGSILASYGFETIRATRAVEALRQSEEKYRTILESMKEGYFELDLKGRLVFFNDAVCEITGYSRDELVGMHYRQYTTEECSLKLYALFNEIYRTGEPALSANYDTIRKDGSVRYFDLSAFLMHDSSGKPTGFRGLARDITERIHASEDRRRLAAAVEHAAESIIITDQDGAIRYVNPAFERISGYKSEEVLGNDLRMLGSDKQGSDFFEKMWITLKKGERWNGRITNLRKNGSPCECETTISPIRDEFQRISGFVCVGRDVTHEVELESQLRQAQKMEAVGTLAGGIAHDFNNLLQAVLGYAEVLLLSKKEGQPGNIELQEIVRAAKRGGQLTQQLLTFSRKVNSVRRPVDLNEELLAIRNLIDRTIPKMIRIDFNLEARLKPINADPIQVGQILVNLVVNAKDAMPEGGEITIKTSNVKLDQEYCSVYLEVQPGDYVLLSLSDTGHGMTEEVMEHIFEPFYSTKGPGKGTGLGLAMVYGIVKSHGGHIACRSKAGEGTTFDIFFPAAGRVGKESQRGLDALAGEGNETILLVDDEESIRTLGEKMLSRFGYRVLTAVDGESALRIFQLNREKIGLVILDIIMPGMGGKRCLEEIRRIHPEARVIISSGYAPDEAVSQAIGFGAKYFIGKPFEMQELLTAVRKVLDERQESGIRI